MKKVVIAMLFSAVSATAISQTIIPKAGISIATLSAYESEDTEDIGTTKSKVGLTIGVGFNLPVSDVFSVQPEISYIRKGAKAVADMQMGFGDESYSVEGTSHLGIDYLEIPILTKFTFGTNTKFFFTAGPSIGFGLGGKTKMDMDITYSFDGTTEKISVSETGKVKFEEEPEGFDEDQEDFNAYIEKRMDIGVQLGAGILIKEKVMVDVRYGLGLSSLDSDESIKNRAIQITVGMPLRLK